jgi:hypothetical protein
LLLPEFIELTWSCGLRGEASPSRAREHVSGTVDG